MSAKQIVAEIERFKGRVKLVAVLDTLEYLRRGGRLPKAAARLGEAAKLKPVVVISEEGEVGLSTAVLGRKRALDTLLKKVAKYSVDAFFPAIPIYSFGTKTCAKMVERDDRRWYEFVWQASNRVRNRLHTSAQALTALFL